MNSPWTPTVLVVDDDRISRTALAELLKDECRVILAKDGESALRRLEEEDEVSLLLLDVLMPAMDGYELLKKIRSGSRSADTAAIFITSRNEETNEEHGLLLGAVDYIFKPINPSVARVRIRNHLKLVAQHKEMERLADHDALTGLANRRYFDQAFELACRHAMRTGEPLGLSIIDVDFFKQYNDCYGHAAGDTVLRQVAGVIAGVALRPYDVAVRYGGEEFLLLLPGVQDLETMLDKMRQEILALDIPHAGSLATGVVSVSCGGIVIDGLREYNPEMLLNLADTLLYKAKQRGRNRVVTECYDAV